MCTCGPLSADGAILGSATCEPCPAQYMPPALLHQQVEKAGLQAAQAAAMGEQSELHYVSVASKEAVLGGVELRGGYSQAEHCS